MTNTGWIATMTNRIAVLTRRFREARRGGVAIQMGLLTLALIGMAALAVEIGSVLYEHRKMQSVADAAAAGAGLALVSGYPAPELEARALAAAAGFVAGVNGVAVSVNIPPANGEYKNNNQAVEVVITQPRTLTMVGLFRSALFDLTARAVSLAGTTGGYCVLSLDPTSCSAVTIANNVAINPIIQQSSDCLNRCGVAANSNCSTALTLANNASINGPVSVVGNWRLAPNAKLACLPAKNNAASLADPYASVTIPPSPLPGCPSTLPLGCLTVCLTIGLPCTGANTTVTLYPGRYRNGWNYTNNVTVNLSPGVYYIERQLVLGNNVTVNGQGGVTLILSGAYAVNLGNNLTLNINAPTSGPYAGIAMATPRNAPPTISISFYNNAFLNITGALYFPNQIVKFYNNGVLNADLCAQVIARIVDLQNNVVLKSGCPSSGIQPIGVGSSRLVE